jgi:hypothetical protein
MSNDLIQSLGNTLPAELREQLAEAVAADLARLGSTSGKDTIRISQDKKFIFPDDTEAAGPIDLIIVDFVYRNEYYPGAFNRKEMVPPTCFAVSPEQSLLMPTKNAPKRQVEDGKKCNECQWDRWGSSPQGDGKACKNTIYMAVLQPDATSDSQLFVIKTSPTAIKSFNKHVADVARKAQLPTWMVVTRLSFDQNLSYPSLRFEVLGLNQIVAETQKRRDDARFRLLQEPDFTLPA